MELAFLEKVSLFDTYGAELIVVKVKTNIIIANLIRDFKNGNLYFRV